MNQEQLDRFVQEFAEVVRTTANSNEELEPAIVPFNLSGDGPRPIKDISVIPLGGMMSLCKDSMRFAVHTTLEVAKSDGYLFMTEAWMSAMQPGETAADAVNLPPSKRENRVTILKVTGRLRSGLFVTFVCEASNVVGDRFTKPFEKFDNEESGRFANFFDKEPA